MFNRGTSNNGGRYLIASVKTCCLQWVRLRCHCDVELKKKGGGGGEIIGKIHQTTLCGRFWGGVQRGLTPWYHYKSSHHPLWLGQTVLHYLYYDGMHLQSYLPVSYDTSARFRFKRWEPMIIWLLSVLVL